MSLGWTDWVGDVKGAKKKPSPLVQWSNWTGCEQGKAYD